MLRSLPMPDASWTRSLADIAAYFKGEDRLHAHWSAVLGDALNFPMPHLVGAISGLDLGQAFRAPIDIDQPALLVAGTLDGRTPLEEQAEVAAQFRRKVQVTVENAGHNVFEAHPQVQDLLVRFFGGEDVADTRLALPPPVFALG